MRRYNTAHTTLSMQFGWLIEALLATATPVKCSPSDEIAHRSKLIKNL